MLLRVQRARQPALARRLAQGPPGEALASPKSLRPCLPNAAQVTKKTPKQKKNEKKRRAQMERAAEPLQKQSAPRKQMLLLQQARSCWLLRGSFSQAHEGGKQPRSNLRGCPCGWDRMPQRSKPFSPTSVPTRESCRSFRPTFPPRCPSFSPLIHL